MQLRPSPNELLPWLRSCDEEGIVHSEMTVPMLPKIGFMKNKRVILWHGPQVYEYRKQALAVRYQGGRFCLSRNG
jgi:hypothetical protein